MKNIAVVCGGFSKEEIISLKSAEQITQTIDNTRYKVYTVLISTKGWFVKSKTGDISIDKADFSFQQGADKVCFDAVFMAIHGTPGEDGKLQSYFELLNIPLTTCSTFVSALTFNKIACKSYLKEYGFPTAKAFVVRKGQGYSEQAIIEKLGLPIFVKPNNGGSSFGVSKVKLVEELAPAIEKAFLEDDELILEEFIDGKEFTCGMFANKEKSFRLPITEIVSKTEFFDFKAKYEGLSDEITPAQITDEETKKIQDATSEIYNILGCSGVVRIDFLQKGNEFYFMEVNTVPGMSEESIIPQQVRAYGLTVTEFYTLLIEDAIDRSKALL